MILTEKLFKMRYRVGASVKPAVVIHADSMSAADTAALLYAADQDGYQGEEVVILSATVIELASL
jgi:hypothetical protein